MLEHLKKKNSDSSTREFLYTVGVVLLEKLKLSGNNENNFIHN